MSARGSLAFPQPEREPSPQGVVRKFVHFKPATVRPPARVDLLLVVQYDKRAFPVTVSGEYCPILSRNPWLYAGGDPIHGGRVIAWGVAPVVTEQEVEDAQ